MPCVLVSCACALFACTPAHLSRCVRAPPHTMAPLLANMRPRLLICALAGVLHIITHVLYHAVLPRSRFSRTISCVCANSVLQATQALGPNKHNLLYCDNY